MPNNVRTVIRVAHLPPLTLGDSSYAPYVFSSLHSSARASRGATFTVGGARAIVSEQRRFIVLEKDGGTGDLDLPHNIGAVLKFIDDFAGGEVDYGDSDSIAASYSWMHWCAQSSTPPPYSLFREAACTAASCLRAVRATANCVVVHEQE